MGTLRWKILPLSLLGLTAVGTVALGWLPGVSAGDAPADELELSDAPGAPLEAGLSVLRADPTPWLGRRVHMTLQFRATVEGWNPYMTRFGTGDWSAFEAWPDERFTWDQAVFDDPAPRLFVRRGSAADEALAEARCYQRFEAVAVVREIFLDEPWIEVESLEPLEEFVGEGTILHVARAMGLMEDGQWELAFDQLQRARAAPLPGHARREIDRIEREARRTRAEIAESLEALR